MEAYLSHLVSLKTISSDLTTNQRALDYVQQFLEAHDMFVVRQTYNGYGTLVATTTEGSKTPKVLLAAHMDVVPGPESVFSLRHEDGKFLGRGVFDMKFAIAAYMDVVESLGASLANYDLGIMITTDEELGGLHGTAKLVEMGYKPQVCVMPDGAQDWQIETFAKGFAYGLIEVNGKQSHGSRPWEGDSATFHLIDLLHELKQYFADQTLDTNTLNIGMLKGGNAKNQTPAYASATLDIRFISEAERTRTITYIAELCQKYNATFTEEPIAGYVCVNDLANPMIRPFAESIITITGANVSGTISYGGSDARFFASVGVPSIICRPAGGSQHADEEWIDAQGMLQYPAVLIDYLNKVAKRV